jgi:peptide deformylase
MLKYKDIIKEPNTILLKKCEEVEFPLSNADKSNLKIMMDYIVNSQIEDEASQLRPGVGLAAPQIGVNKRYFVIHFEEKGKEYHEYMINPKIIATSETLAYLNSGEGCLSVEKDYSGVVLRNHRIVVEYFNLEGQKKEKTFSGFASIVIQHENDHLNGILFHSKIASPLQKELVEKAIEI